MKKRTVNIIPVLVAGLLIFSCSPRSRYDSRLEHELASGVRYDSIFMGIYLGMPDKDFYAHCWMLNREGLIKQSPSNLAVEYELEDELKFPATMHFYPEFGQGRIVEMPVRFIYNGWAPWNTDLSADALQSEVLKWFEQGYGDGFLKVEHPEHGMAFVKIDGNRRITIFRQDDMYVWAVFTDMLAIGEPDDPASEEGAIYDDITKELE